MLSLKDITTWSVSKGVATPKNPYKHQIGKTRDFTVKISEQQLYSEFKVFAQQHTYATNAPDGSYSADCFDEPVLQMHLFLSDTWVTVGKNKAGYTYRQFLTLKQQNKAETNTTDIIIGNPEILKLNIQAKKYSESFDYIPEIESQIYFAFKQGAEYRKTEAESPKFGEWISVEAMHNSELQKFAHNVALDVGREMDASESRQVIKQMIVLGAQWQSKQQTEVTRCLEAFINSYYTGCSKDELNQLRINGEKALEAILPSPPKTL